MQKKLLIFLTALIPFLIAVIFIMKDKGEQNRLVSNETLDPSPRARQTEETPRSEGRSTSGLRGRRGIIKQIFPASFSLVIEPIDSYAYAGEQLVVQIQPVTTHVLITILPEPNRDGTTVERKDNSWNNLKIDDDVFIISIGDITASTSFSALRIEKIVTP